MINPSDLKQPQPPKHFKINKCCALCGYVRVSLESYRKLPLPDIMECSLHNHTMKNEITMIASCKDYKLIK